jgi:hypothetical protein
MLQFSEHEKMILKILGRRKMTVQKISEEFYLSRGGGVPLSARNYVNMVIRRIAAKCEIHNANWTIKGKGGGRGGKVVWRGLKRLTRSNHN